MPGAGRDRHDAAASSSAARCRRGRPASRAARCSCCSCMSATSRRSTVPAPVEHRHRALGLVGVDVDAQRARVADDQHRVADLLERETYVRPARSPPPETTKFVQ